LAGRTTLIKATLAAIPNHNMQIFDLPKATQNKIDSIQRNFLWGSTEEKRKCHLLNWNKVTSPKNQGSLGLYKTSYKNKAFSTSLAWRYLNNKEALWVKIPHSKYDRIAPRNNRLIPNPGSSHIWKNIHNGRKLCQKGINWIIGNGENINLWNNRWINQGNNLRNSIQGPLQNGEEDMKVSSIIQHGSFNLSTLSFEIPEDIIQKIHSTYIQQSQPGRDKISWNSPGHNSFSIKAAYDLASLQDTRTEENNLDYKWIWKCNTLNKLKYFMCLLTLNRLPTATFLAKRNICTSDTCTICGTEKEDIKHILFYCTYSKEIWRQFHIKHNYPSLDNGLTTFHWLKHQLKSNKSFNQYITWPIFLPFLLWYLWTTRNERIFHKSSPYPNISKVINSTQEFLFLSNWSPTRSPKRTILIKWEPPDVETYKLNIDGSCLGSLGKGGTGGVFRNSNGKWILGFSKGFANATNIQMEAMSLLQGLQLAIQKRLIPLVIETDCQDLINLINNEKMLYRNIIDDCRFLLSEVGAPPLKHAFREANGVADALAK
ncbi:putative ribonuclease h protein, partial [Nicotiana attenuata]